MTEPSERLFTRDFLLLTLAHFLSAGGWASALIFPLYVDSLDADRTHLGLIMASAGIGGLAVRPFVGWALDVWGRRPVIVAGSVTMAISLLLVLWVRDLGPLVYVHRIIFGLGMGALFTAYFAFAADHVPAHRRTEGIAIFGISGLLPLGVLPFVGDLGFSGDDLRLFYPVIGAVLLLSMVVAMFVRERPHPDRGRPIGLRRALRSLAVPQLLPVWLATFIFASLVAVYAAFAVVAASNRAVPRPADLFLAYAIGACSVRLFGARLPDRIGPERLVVPALLLFVAGVVVTAVAGSWLGFVAGGVLCGLGHGYCFPVLMAQVVSRSPPALHGSATAVYTALWVVGDLALTPLFGALADGTSDEVMFLVLAAVAIAGLAAWRVLETRHGGGARRPRRRPRDRPA